MFGAINKLRLSDAERRSLRCYASRHRARAQLFSVYDFRWVTAKDDLFDMEKIRSLRLAAYSGESDHLIAPTRTPQNSGQQHAPPGFASQGGQEVQGNDELRSQPSYSA